MSLPTVTGVARLVEDPQLRFTSSGKGVTKMRLAFSARRRNPQTNEWEDGDKCFLDAEVWEPAAENVAESLSRGMEVVVSGRLRQREYEARDGGKRTVFDLLLDSIGPSLKFASVKVSKMQRSGGGDRSNGGGSFGGGTDDPWSTAAPAPSGARSGGGSFDDSEPPF